MIIMKKFRWLALALALCAVVCLSACDGEKTRQAQPEQSLPADAPNMGEPAAANDGIPSETEPDASAPDASEANPTEMTLIVENNRYPLTADDAENMREILSLEDMTATEDDESFYAYEFVTNEAHYSVLPDLTKIQASVVSDDGEYSHYEKQTTQAEQATLKSVISNYEGM